jgi:alkylhydroperoxidase family enzyme
LRAAAGASALAYVLVLGSFHYVNRIADLLHVDSDFLPEPLLRFGALRRVGVSIGSRVLATMDLANRPYAADYEEALAAMSPVFLRATGREPGVDLEALRERPAMIEVLRHSLEERDERSLLSRTEAARVHALVEQALPASVDEARGFHARPADPVEAFVFVGTRYAARTTEGMVEALRAAGHDDLRILDLAHAVADANQWARMHRLLALDPGILTPATLGPAA